MALILLEIGIIYFLGQVFMRIFQRFKIPDVLFLMSLGILMGPVLSWTSPVDFGRSGAVLSTMALLVILFQSGFTLNLRSLAEVSGIGSFITFATFLSTFAAATLISFPFTQSWPVSVLAGVILAGTSSAVVIPMSQSLGLSERAKSILLLESAITDVLCIVLTLALTRTFASEAPSKDWSTSTFSVLGEIGLSFSLAIMLGLLAGALWTRFKKQMQSLATLAFALGIYGVVELLGLSGPIAVMSMGFGLANPPAFMRTKDSVGLTENEVEFYSELSFVLKTFFFIFLGISIRFDSPTMIVAAAVLTLVILLLRGLLVRKMFRSFTDRTEANYIILMIPKGLAAAVLADIPAQKGVLGAEILPQFVYATVLMSIALVSIFVGINGVRARSSTSIPSPQN
jgi:NhaP-type Na+/H+ or K+/H+ antiporter